jgi:predicted permease
VPLRRLRLRVRALFAPRRVERELDDELAFHIEREAQKLLAAGARPEEARARARARFGSASLTADECRDVRGADFVDASLRDVRDALRSVRRAPLVAVTIVATIALGLGLAAAAFTLFNAIVLRVDAVRDPGALFAVEKTRSAGSAAGSSDRPRFSLQEYEDLRSQTGVFDGVFAQLPDITSRIDGRMMEGHLVTGNFFEVLGVEAALGRTLNPLDAARHAGRPVIVLSHAGWSRLFASDPGIIGRRVVVNGNRYEIVGVTPQGFRGLGVAAPDYWAPLSLVGQFRPWYAGREDSVAVHVVGRLKEGLSVAAARAGLAVWATGGRSSRSQGPHGASPIRLESRRTATPLSPGVILAFSPLFAAFGLVLMIGCANVTSLLLARAVSRQREIGIRLSLGASRARVVRQLLTESLLLALASAACALAISRIVLDGTTLVLMRTMPPELAEMVHLGAPGSDWRVAVFLLIAALVSTLVFGLAPALQGTRLDLVRTMRGEVSKDARPSRARNLLIVAQVTASALLLICAGIFLRGAMRAAEVDPGLRTTDTIVVDIVNEPFRAAMNAAVTATASVRAVAASSPEPLNRPRAAFLSATGRPETPVAYRFASSEYFDVLGIRVLRGRTFTAAEARARASVAIVSETTARTLWANADPVGKVLQLEADPTSETRSVDEPPLPSRSFTVVGVVRDVAGFRIAGTSDAGVYLPTAASVAETVLIVRVHGDPELARVALLERLSSIDPNMGQVMTLRTLGRLETYPLQVAFWLAVALGGLALVLTISGIFGVLSYLVAQRTKEIGVRLALGARAANVTWLVLWQSLRVVGAGLIGGGALAGALAALLMSTPAADRISLIVDVFDPIAYAASLLVIVVACTLAASVPALRAARIDPIATLRND